MAVLAHPDDESYGIGGTLARYAHEGVDVHVVIATNGAAGSVDEAWGGDRQQLAEARRHELEQACAILGAKLHMLNYRDSGYINDPANQHPDAFINCDPRDAIGKVVALIRRLQPQVVVTHDETGGYFHPDHIRCYEIVTPAFHAAGDPDQYAEIGPEPYQPVRLYYSVFSHRWVRVINLLMRLRGRDPTRVGRNQDIDFTSVGVDPDEITTTIDYGRYWDLKRQASAAHGSQGGGTSLTRLLPEWLQRMLFAHETFVRAHPPVPPGYSERDFFDFAGETGN